MNRTSKENYIISKVMCKSYLLTNDLNRRKVNNRLKSIDISLGIKLIKEDEIRKVKPCNSGWKKKESYKSRGCLLKLNSNGYLESL